MKKPVIVLAITAFATFVMGWVAHRVYRNSQALTIEQNKEANQTPVQQISPVSSDTVVVKTDSNLYHQTNYIEPAKADSIEKVKSHFSEEKNEIPVDEADIRKEFKPKKSFDDFKIDKKYKGAFAKRLDFTSCKSGQLYHTETRRAVEKGIVFAGRYAFAKINCGTDCYASTLVDLKTGKVYAGPHATGGYKFQADSRLLIINPPDKDNMYTPCEVCDPVMYEWTGKKFVRVI